MARIEAPIKEPGQVTGVGGIVFTDGVAETDNPAVIGYCQAAGYTVNGKRQGVDDVPVVDSRDVTTVDLGTRLRDAAVDPQPEDFLPPVNAGEADPHGPEVVSPGIHAVSGPGPIVPGPVGRFEEDDDGSTVVVDDIEEQQRRETTAAEQVFLEQRDVGEVTAELGEEVGQPAPEAVGAVETADGTVHVGELPASAAVPAGNASTEEWRAYAIAQGMPEDEANGLGRDALRDRYTS